MHDVEDDEDDIAFHGESARRVAQSERAARLRHEQLVPGEREKLLALLPPHCQALLRDHHDLGDRVKVTMERRRNGAAAPVPAASRAGL